MILQKNPRLNKDIQEVGCLFLCLARMVEDLFSYKFEPEQLNDIWDKAVKNNKIILRKMVDPDGVLLMLKNVIDTDSKTRIMQIGQTLNDYTQYWGWVKEAYKKNVFTMAMEKTGGLIGKHFILVNNSNDKIITYDSMNFNRIGETTNAKRFIYYAVL